MSGDASNASRCRALIVEDDADSCWVAQRILARHGYAVECASSVAEGLAKLEKKPSCLIVDLMLPDGSGNQIIREARRAHPGIKIAVMTAAAGHPMAADAVMLRPDALFVKPVDYTELLGWLTRVDWSGENASASGVLEQPGSGSSLP